MIFSSKSAALLLGLLGAERSLRRAVGVEGLVLPPPSAPTHGVLRRPHAPYGHRRSAALAPGMLPKQRPGSVCLGGPLNVMSMDRAVPEPINVTALVDPGSLDVIDWAYAPDAPGTSLGVTTEERQQRAVPDFLPKELPIVEEEVVVIECPEEANALFPRDSVAESPHKASVREDHPSVSKIIKFSLPAIGVWLCSPVLSMIDTASVGLLAGTAQQAALNPAVSVTDYGALLVAFMYTATTNLIAGAVEKDLEGGKTLDGLIEGDGARPRTTRTLVTALRLALLVGITFGTILGTAAPILLRMLIGNSSLDPTVFESALRYVQIRSLGMPAAVVIGTAQSACLGMKDVRSPLYVLAAAAGINLLGDLMLVRNANPWMGGAAGAAWATVLSQYGALVMFLRWLTMKNGREDIRQRVLSPMEMIKDASNNAGKHVKVKVGNAFERRSILRKSLFSSNEDGCKVVADKETPHPHNHAQARGFLYNSHTLASIINPLRLMKSQSMVKSFLPFVVPVTTTSIGRVSGFLTMSHVASSAFGTLDMAAHQIAISIFCCLAPIVDALNQVSQSFVPGIFARRKSPARARALRRTSVNFAKVGALFGSVIVALVTLGVPVLSRCFTTDPTVLSRVRNAIPGIAAFLGFDGLMCIGEGTLLGQNDLKFLRNMYASFFFLVPAVMLRLKRRALNGIEVGIGTMWGYFSGYEVIRTILWLGRVAWLQYKTEREVAEMEVAT